MIKTILGWVLVLLIVAIVILLFINGGGIKSILQTAGSAPSLRELIFGDSSPLSDFQLPGQGGIINAIGIDVETGGDISGYETVTTANDVALAEYGTPSRSVGTVTLRAVNAHAANAQEEYVTLTASPENSGAVTVSGWSIHSVKNGARLIVPVGAPSFVPGLYNRVSDVTLSPGGSALVFTGISPVGVSYRENKCTVYVNNVQSYAACVSASQNAQDFQLSTWRLYAGFTKEFWSNAGDTLLLVDRTGAVVDSTSY